MTKSIAPRTRITTALLGLTAAGLFTAPALAHHSFAMYDQSVTKAFTGKLIRFITGANHAQLYFEVVDDKGEKQIGTDGKPLVWGVETGPAAMIAQQGVTVKDFPIGTVVTVSLNPLRDGRPFGAMATGAYIVKCGMEVPKGGCTRETGKVFLESNR